MYSDRMSAERDLKKSRHRSGDSSETVDKIKRSSLSKRLFNLEDCRKIERKINEVVEIGIKGGYKSCTVDRSNILNIGCLIL